MQHERRRHLTSVATWSVFLVSAALGLGCSGRSRIHCTYELRLPTPAESALPINVRLTLRLHNARQLALLGLGAGFSDPRLAIHATIDGDSLTLHRESTASGERWSASLSPTPHTIVLAYRTWLDRREGDERSGLSHRRLGHLGSDYCLLPGREVCLIPEVPDDVGQVALSIRGTGGRSAIVGPWPVTNGVARIHSRGRGAIEDLVAGEWLIGNVHEEPLSPDLSNIRVARISNDQPNQALEGRERIIAGLKSVRALLGVSVCPRYQLILLPQSASGPVDAGSAWSMGQAAPATPLTDAALLEMLVDYAASYLRFSQRHLTIEDPTDYWLVDGLERWAGLRATYSATGRSDDAFRQALAEQLFHLAMVGGTKLDLESLYADGSPADRVTHVLAPAGIEEVSIRLIQATGDSLALSRLIGRWMSNRRTTKFWPAIQAVLGKARTDSLRETIRWKSPYALLALTHLSPVDEPVPTVRWDAFGTRSQTLIASGDLEGYLENCGCKANQAGGMARRARAISALRARASDALLVDAGSFLAQPEKIGDMDSPAELEQDLFVSLMADLRYDAVALGSTELASDPERLVMAQRRGIPLVCANVRRNGQLLCRPYLVRQVGGLRVGIIGLFEPPPPQERTPLLDQRLGTLSVSSALASYQEYAGELARESDVTIVLGSIDPSLVRRFAHLSSPPALIVSRNYHTVVNSDEGLRQQDRTGRVGKTWVMYTRSTRYGLDFASFGHVGRGGLRLTACGSRRLDEGVPDEPVVRKRLDAFYADVSKMAVMGATYAALDLDDSASIRGGYAGAEACRGCHSEEYAQWKGTPHAGAFKTLLDAHRHYQPRCVICHVVGLGTPLGYKLGSPSERLANVQCESCHGSGVEHLADPAGSAMRASVPERVCVTCHTAEHSEAFDYRERIRLVAHRGAPTPAVAVR